MCVFACRTQLPGHVKKTSLFLCVERENPPKPTFNPNQQEDLGHDPQSSGISAGGSAEL